MFSFFARTFKRILMELETFFFFIFRQTTQLPPSSSRSQKGRATGGKGGVFEFFDVVSAVLFLAHSNCRPLCRPIGTNGPANRCHKSGGFSRMSASTPPTPPPLLYPSGYRHFLERDKRKAKNRLQNFAY